ncbi:unnamed protein product, partial [Mesorhabditis belari]|uniref:Uncharacterized protein n=1 Tax=Mesorhabditis belari TaxID=2138241 RepID=A0AAF3ETJ5_9BILA
MINGLTIERLKFTNCSSPLNRSIPSLFLRSFTANQCRLSTVLNTIFSNVQATIEDVDLSDNKIVTIPLFGTLPRLKTLNLNKNLIKTIPEQVFNGMVNLRHLRLAENQICDLDGNVLNEVKNTLETLDLSGNCLIAVPAPNIRNSIRLTTLYLTGNKLAKIEKMHFMNLPLLREVQLAENQLTFIDGMAFMNVPKLQILNLNQNLLTNFDISRLQAFKDLEVLDVSKNKLLKVPSVKDMLKLKYLRLDGNLIETVDTLTFSNLPSLQLLSLQENRIEMVARNAFDSLDKLMILLLANNSLKTIEMGMLDGMRHLQQINLRNNTLREIEATAFSSLLEITSIDLSNNQIERISKASFDGLSKLFWLDLSDNRLKSFEQGTFGKRIANLILNGNDLQCDKNLDWFLEYLVINRVRTFLAFQPEITCSGPEESRGIPLRDFLIKKANETVIPSSSTPNFLQQALLKSLLGNLKTNNPIPTPIQTPIPRSSSSGTLQSQNTLSSMDPITLISRLSETDLDRFIQAMPSLQVSLPGLGNVDLSKLDPSVIKYVLKGGTIPGVSKETTDAVMRQALQKMMQNVQATQSQPQPQPQQTTERRKNQLPMQRIGTAFSPNFLTQNSHQQKLPLPNSEWAHRSGFLANNGNENFQLMQLLPPGYDISKIPAQVIQAVTRGEVPDIKLLPSDLQEYLKVNSEKLLETFSKQVSNVSLNDLLAKMPNFDRPELETFEPYDINMISHELHKEDEEKQKDQNIRIYTAICLGLVAVITCIVLGFLYVHMKRQSTRNSSFSSH